MMFPLFVSLIFSGPLTAHAQTVLIQGEAAHFLYDYAEKMRFEDDSPSLPDTEEFLGGCFYTKKREKLTRLFCECSVGRIHQPDPLLSVLEPYLRLAPFPDFDDIESGITGYVFRIEYSCRRSHLGRNTEYRCQLEDGSLPTGSSN